MMFLIISKIPTAKIAGNCICTIQHNGDIRIRVPKGEKSKVQAHATATVESMNAFVVRAIRETMTRDNLEKK